MGKQAKPPGLRRVKRRGREDLYWSCSAEARAAGYPTRNVKLNDFATDPAGLLERCRRLQGEMMMWLAGEDLSRANPYDGTIGGLLRLYQTHDESSFRRLRPASAKPYRFYAAKLEETVGARRISGITGLDVQRWHGVWSRGGAHLAAAHVALAVLKAALAFGAVCGHAECGRLREVLKLLRLDLPKPRDSVIGAAQVIAIRKEAHKQGVPSAALAAALQFEGSLRLWDVIGQWVPMTEPGLSTIVRGETKWIGLQWSAIDAGMILRLTPSKTERTSGAKVAVDLNFCPMVLEEITRIAPERRVGPMIVNEATGLPYQTKSWPNIWRRLARAAGLPDALWSRDLKASAITEGRAAGATIDDSSKVAGHSKPRITAEVYDRAHLEAARRFSKARISSRSKGL